MRRTIEAYGRGDLDKALTYADPNIVWNPAEEAPTQGHDAVRANSGRWEQWDDYEAFAEDLIEADVRLYEVWTLRGGKAIRMDEFTERSEALEAAGLG